MAINLYMKIAPSRYGGDWIASDWVRLRERPDFDWQTAIDIFEDRITYRFLNNIAQLQQGLHTGFAVMALECLLIEKLAQFYDGKKESPRKQNRAFYISFLTKDSIRISKEFDTQQKAELFYDTIRCGILHQGETKGSSLIKKCGPSAFELTPDGEGLIIYRTQFHETLLMEELRQYLQCLRDGLHQVRRGNFVTKMNYICHLPEFEE